MGGVWKLCLWCFSSKDRPCICEACFQHLVVFSLLQFEIVSGVVPTIRPFAVKETRAGNSLSWFQGSGLLFSLSHSFPLCGLQWFVQRLSVWEFYLWERVSSISSVVFLICILVLEIFSIFCYFFPSCFGVLHVHLFVNNDMGLTSRQSECNNIVPPQSFSGSLIVIHAANA